MMHITEFHRSEIAFLKTEIEKQAERIRVLREALALIAEQDPIENVLDPQWAARIAKGGLEATK